jgi:hypothetical protein
MAKPGYNNNDKSYYVNVKSYFRQEKEFHMSKFRKIVALVVGVVVVVGVRIEVDVVDVNATVVVHDDVVLPLSGRFKGAPALTATIISVMIKNAITPMKDSAINFDLKFSLSCVSSLKNRLFSSGERSSGENVS